MNKLSKLLVLLVVITTIVGCIAACDRTKPCTEHVDANTDYICDDCEATLEQPAHEHNFVEGKCECGEEDPTYTPPHVHSYTNGVCSCGQVDPDFEPIDYASQIKFNPNSGRAWANVTVKSYIDGDTTHFYINEDKIEEGFFKARYLAINTPESTGVMEPWGKKASEYTKTQLMKATSIIAESDTATWDLDSTGGRYLVWIWYRTSETEEYRNLNLEILQQGLAYGSNVSSNTYGEYALAALNQAKTLKYHVFSKDKDPDFYYGGAVSLTLKELKASTYWDPDYENSDGTKGRYCNPYEGILVKFEGIVAKQVDATVYIEEYDAENDMYFGMQIFCGYSYPKMDEFKIGNRMSIVGKLQYYENGKTFQISSLKYKTIDPNWEGGCRVLETGHSASFKEVDVETIMNGSIVLDVTTEKEDENGEIIETTEKVTFDYGQLAHYSTVTVKNLIVTRVWTTTSETDSDGALSIYCVDENGNEITIRTASKLIHTDGTKPVVAGDFPKGTVITVKGVIDYYNGDYQIKVFDIKDITYEN